MNQTKNHQYEALCRPFPIEAIKQREQGGATISYYPIEVVRTRLNDIFAGSYEFHCNQVIVTDTTMDMSFILTLRWADGSTTVVEDWGSSDILRSKDGTRRVNDPAKTCASDALKRCLAFVGCGAELYSESYRDSVTAQKQQQEDAARQKQIYTCSHCQGEITGGFIGGKELSQDDVVRRTRVKFKKRLCIPCAMAVAAQAAKAVA